MQKQFLTRIILDLPLELFILPSLHSPTGLFVQQEHPIEWIYTHFRTRSLMPYLDLIALIIINERNKTEILIGCDPHKTVIPVNKLSILNDFQKLLGNINWIRPSLDITNYQLTILFNTLKRDPYLNSPCSLSQEAGEELCLIQNKLQKQFLTRIRFDLPLKLFILPSLHSPTGFLTQQ